MLPRLGITLTIFSTSKLFRNNTKVLQTNAIRSWIALSSACELMLFGDEKETAEVASVRSLTRVPGVP